MIKFKLIIIINIFIIFLIINIYNCNIINNNNNKIKFKENNLFTNFIKTNLKYSKLHNNISPEILLRVKQGVINGNSGKLYILNLLIH